MADVFVEIPTRVDLPAYSMVVPLSGVNYQVTLTFNERINNGVGKWLMSVEDPQGVTILDAVPVLADWPLFDRFSSPTLPPGSIIAFDTSGKHQDPGRFDLGDRVRLIYGVKSG